jgi:hypothetical protein
LIFGEPDGEGVGQGATQVVVRKAVHAEGEGGAAGTLEGGEGRIVTRSQGSIDAESILGRCGLFEEAGDCEFDGGIIGGIASGDEELGALD